MSGIREGKKKKKKMCVRSKPPAVRIANLKKKTRKKKWGNMFTSICLPYSS